MPSPLRNDRQETSLVGVWNGNSAICVCRDCGLRDAPPGGGFVDVWGSGWVRLPTDRELSGTIRGCPPPVVLVNLLNPSRRLEIYWYICVGMWGEFCMCRLILGVALVWFMFGWLWQACGTQLKGEIPNCFALAHHFSWGEITHGFALVTQLQLRVGSQCGVLHWWYNFSWELGHSVVFCTGDTTSAENWVTVWCFALVVQLQLKVGSRTSFDDFVHYTLYITAVFAVYYMFSWDSCLRTIHSRDIAITRNNTALFFYSGIYITLNLL